jgi:hypothetical protein
MNEIRARYKMAPVEGGDAKMFNEDADLARRVKAAAVMKVRASVDEVQGAHEETETIEFIESVVVEDAVVEDGEPEAAAADDDAEEAETVASEVEDAIAAAMENAVAEDTDAIVDVFAALTEEEIAAKNSWRRSRRRRALKTITKSICSKISKRQSSRFRQARRRCKRRRQSSRTLKPKSSSCRRLPTRRSRR